MSEVIVVTSGKGVLARRRLFSECRYRTCHAWGKSNLIDTDIGLRKPRRGDGTAEPHRSATLRDVGEETAVWCQATDKRQKDIQTLFLFPSAQTRDKSSVTPGQMRKLVDESGEEFDYVLLDCPCRNRAGI